MPRSRWTREDKDLLISFHQQEMRIDEIAVRLGRTRDAVLGKLHRMLIITREKAPVMPKRERKLHRRDEFIDFGPIHDITITGGVQPDSEGVSLLAVTEDQCRWPLEEKAKDGSPRCCGEPCAVKSSYCAFHRDRARADLSAGG